MNGEAAMAGDSGRLPLADRLSVFLKSGVYLFENANALFLDPVRVLNRSYTRFRVSPSAYYSRFFPSSNLVSENHNDAPNNLKKRKRRVKNKIKAQILNPREEIADLRHQDARPVLLKAHEALLGATQLLGTLTNLRNDADKCDAESPSQENELDFVELGSVWQAPLYEITLKPDNGANENADVGYRNQRGFPLFDNLITNEGSDEIEAEFVTHKYILPKNSGFYMSDLRQVHNLIPAESDCGFNLIVIDPPWENSSAHQKMKYHTLPNRHFLSLPIKQLTHTDGALVALWVTNREKLRNFVENELFPKWGIKHVTTFYWLKVKSDGSLIGDLDLFHHRPYECLLLGYSQGKEMKFELPNKQVFISVPGEYSRKPPIGELLLHYAPRFKVARCIELFSREMIAGWTSWGNEPLHFQDSRYFVKSTEK